MKKWFYEILGILGLLFWMVDGDWCMGYNEGRGLRVENSYFIGWDFNGLVRVRWMFGVKGSSLR